MRKSLVYRYLQQMSLRASIVTSRLLRIGSIRWMLSVTMALVIPFIAYDFFFHATPKLFERNIFIGFILTVFMAFNIGNASRHTFRIIREEIQFSIFLYKTRRFEHLSSTKMPPGVAEFLLMLAAKDKTCEALAGDLEEQYQRNCNKFGEVRARRLYWAETLRTLGPLLWQGAKRLGIAAAAIAGVKKWIGL